MGVNVLATPKVKALLQELEEWGVENDRVQIDRSRKMLNLERETAELVRALIVGWQPRRILEIGTSNGYSTIWLAASVGQDGSVISIERNPAKLELAKENLLRAELLGRMELLLGDATEIVASCLMSCSSMRIASVRRINWPCCFRSSRIELCCSLTTYSLILRRRRQWAL